MVPLPPHPPGWAACSASAHALKLQPSPLAAIRHHPTPTSPRQRSSRSTHAADFQTACARARTLQTSANYCVRMPCSMLQGKWCTRARRPADGLVLKHRWRRRPWRRISSSWTSSGPRPASKPALSSTVSMGAVRGHKLRLCDETMVEQACRCTVLRGVGALRGEHVSCSHEAHAMAQRTVARQYVRISRLSNWQRKLEPWELGCAHQHGMYGENLLFDP